MDDDATLLRRYAHTRDEAAFAALVRRHLDFVHSVAARCTHGDAHLAHDVSQQVFLALARRAASLARHPCLLGWLHTCACQRAADLLRSEARRRARETAAATDAALAPERPVPWELLAPELDLALQTLGARDRETILARYFAKKSFADIAATLGLTEAAAQMRAARALEKLRRALAARGVTSTASALSVALGANAVTAAPPSLVAALTGLGSPAAIGTTATLSTFFTMSLLKHAATGLVCATLAGFAVHRFTAAPATPQPPPPVSTAPALASPPSPDPRLADLAAENSTLRARLAAAEAELKTRSEESVATRDKLAELRRPMTADILSSTLHATVQPGETIVTGGSVMPNGKRLFAFSTPVRKFHQGQEVVQIATQFLAVTDEAAKSIGLDKLATSAANTLQHGEVWATSEMNSALAGIKASKGTDILSAPGITMIPGNEGQIHVGPALRVNVLPALAPDGKGIEMELRLELDPAAPPDK